MATSPKPEREFESLPLKLAYAFLAKKGLENESDAIRTNADRIDSYTSSLRRAKILALLRKRDLLQQFIGESWPYGSTDKGQKKIKFYDQLYLRYEKLAGKGLPSIDAIANENENGVGKEFVFEEQLRDYLAENLGILEPGLELWPVDNGDAVEFQVEQQGPSRRIDILAKDNGGAPVVIELKVSRGHEKTVGQALYYRARIKRLFGAQRVRIFIVASEISQELRAAASEVPDVLLFEYSLAVTVTKVTSGLN